jgi:hypothetical protein
MVKLEALLKNQTSMKKFSLLVAGFLMYGSTSMVLAQNQNESNVIVCEEFHITKPLIEINKEHPVDLKKIERERMKKLKESPDRKNRKPQNFVFNAEEHGYAYATDTTMIQRYDGSRKGRAPLTNWLGLNASGFRPFDPSGAAGTNYYFQAINATTYKIFNKTTGALVTQGTMGNLWSPATPNDGDPIIMYDRYADRWFISQFGTSGNKIYIAISTTSDPTGTWYSYTFSSPQFPDYLKFAIWHDGYYMTSNQGTQRVFCFERSAMLTGSASARAVNATFNPPDGGGFFCPLPGDADGNGGLPAAGTPCPIFSYSDNAWGGGAIDGIQIYQMSVNWVPTTPTATISFVTALATNAFDASYNASWNDISQPGTSQKLDGIGGVLTYRAQWRKWSGYNSVVLTWAVKISSTQRSIMWAEIRQNQGTGTWSVYQQGVYTPDTYSRWVSSISMDDQGNIALCYAKSGSSTVYPSLGYTGRLASDPLNTMTFAEEIAIAGTCSQTGGVNRFGDYSQTGLDPDGTTFWHTGEYMGGTTGTYSAARTRIYSFQLASATAANVSITSNDADNTICVGQSVTFTAVPTNGGSTPTYQWQVNGSNVGTNSSTYTTTGLTNGQVVTCIMTSNMAGATNNPATSNSVTMVVTAPVTPAVSIASNDANNTICSGQSITFTATPTNGGSTPTYQWQVNGSNVGTNSATYTTTGLTTGAVVTCTMTSSNTCVTTSTANSSSITVTVNPTPSTPTITQNGVVLTSSSATGNQWYLNGVLIPGATGQSYTATANGNYTVVVTSNGCASSASAASTVSTISVDENDPYLTVIYPNPTNGNFTVSFNANSSEKYTLRIYNDIGQIVVSEVINNHNGAYSKAIELGDKASGVYTLTLTNGKVETTKKIVIQK